MPTFEREFWQGGVSFATTVPPLSPSDLLHVVQNLREAVPGEKTLWEVPILSPATNFKLRVGSGGTAVEVARPDLLVGATNNGWFIHLAQNELTVRHNQLGNAVPGAERYPLLAPTEMPSVERFGEVASAALASLPPVLLESVRRATVSVSYGMATVDENPASWVAALYERNRIPIPFYAPDEARLVVGHQELRFEVLDGRRHVWVDSGRVGNWFAPNGPLLQNAAVIRALELKTAIPEPERPGVAIPTIDDLPPIPPDEARRFLETGVRRVLDRFRGSLPAGASLDE